jgi:ribose/xylose/arabinose/galactoside ABC-type transport system permease subunit
MERPVILFPPKLNLGVLVAITIVLAVAVILKWTRFGRNLYAVGGNSHSALTLGINVKRTKFYAYLLPDCYPELAAMFICCIREQGMLPMLRRRKCRQLHPILSAVHY